MKLFDRTMQRVSGLGLLMLAPAILRAQLPANITPPPGHQAFLKAAAAGTQNVICLSGSWTFLGPQATLFLEIPWFGGPIRQQIATHYLIPNPAENGARRPVWQSSLDTSFVSAKPVGEIPSEAPAIPWLLLEATFTQPGPAGGVTLSQTTYIQRIHTTGGLMPATACATGERAFIPYTADYVFCRKTTR